MPKFIQQSAKFKIYRGKYIGLKYSPYYQLIMLIVGTGLKFNSSDIVNVDIKSIHEAFVIDKRFKSQY